MATEGPQITDGGQTITATDLTAKQFYAVKMTATARTVALASTGGEMIYGILQNAPAATEAANVCIFGVTKAQAGGTITAGDPLTTDTAGKLITYTSSKVKVGVALTSGASGDLITAFIFPAQVSA